MNKTCGTADSAHVVHQEEARARHTSDDIAIDRSGNSPRNCPLHGARSPTAWGIPAIGAFALLVRVACVVETADSPFVQNLVGDAAGYFEWAGVIANGNWLGSEGFYQAPLYPYVLAGIFSTVGKSIGIVRCVQALWGALSVVCLGYFTSRIIDRRAGIIAAILGATYGPSIFFDCIIQKTALGGLLLALLLLVMARWRAGKQAWGVALVGLLAGLLALTRENALLWIPLLAVWIIVAASPRARVSSILLFLLGIALPLGLVAVRNGVVSGEWSLSTFQAGPNFYIGNSAHATGRYRPLVRGHETPVFERRDAERLAEADAGRDLTAQEVSSYWMSRAWDDVKLNSTRWLRLLGTKMLMVWNRHEVSDVESLYVYADYSRVLSILSSVLHFGVLCPLSVLGIAMTSHRWRDLWIYYALIGSMAGAVAVFYVMARYRFPLVPLLIPFAGAGCVYLWDSIRARDYRRMLWPIVASVMAGVVANLSVHDERRLDAMAWMNLGVATAQQGDIVHATSLFERALAEHPQSAEAHNNLAQALAIQGHFARAIPHYEAALAIEPDLSGVHFNLAVALERAGRIDEAIRSYRRALDANPDDPDAEAALRRLGS